MPNKIEALIIVLAIIFADRLHAAAQPYQGVVFVLVLLFGGVCAVSFLWGIWYALQKFIRSAVKPRPSGRGYKARF